MTMQPATFIWHHLSMVAAYSVSPFACEHRGYIIGPYFHCYHLGYW